MAQVAIVFGLLLIFLGVGGYAATGMASATALIPAYFGVVLTILGVVARQPNLRRHAMHAAAVVALLGLLGTARGLVQLPALLTGGEVARPGAVMAQSLMALLMLIFVILAVKSFVDARRRGAV